MKTKHFNVMAAAYAAAIVSAVGMLFIGIAANIGIYKGAANMMIQWHEFFDLSIVGILLGIIEAAVIGFLFVAFFAWLYNTFNRK